MSLRLPNTTRHLSFSLRLTVWYTLTFAVCLSAMLIVFYYQLKVAVFAGIDGVILQEMGELREWYATRGLENVAEQLELEARELGTNKAVFRIIRADGSELAASDRSQWTEVPVQPEKINQALRLGNKAVPSSLKIGTNNAVRSIYLALDDKLLVHGVGSLTDEIRLLRRYRLMLIFGGFLVTLLAALVGFFMARRAMSRVKELTSTAQRIHEGRLEERVPLRQVHDEIDHLGQVFNRMVDRMEQLVSRMKQMMDDIAHELRSPIARIRGSAELALMNKQSTDDTQQLAAVTIEELDKMLGLVNTMLDISEADADVANHRAEPVDVAQLLSDAVELFEPVAEQKQITLTLDHIGCFESLGNKQKLQLAFSNILDNAIKYTPAGGNVQIFQPVTEPNSVVIRDSGVGIAADDVPRVFERFFRSGAVLSEPGSGLGLSLTKAVVQSHGGTIVISSELGKGTEVTVQLPVQS